MVQLKLVKLKLYRNSSEDIDDLLTVVNDNSSIVFLNSLF